MTAPISSSSQYATAKLFTDSGVGVAANLSGSPEDSERIKSYILYEDFYYNRPETFKVFLRGDNDSPIYVPSAKKIVEAMNRFLAKDYTFTVQGTDEAVLRQHIGNLWKREKIGSKFANLKRFGLVRGDAMFYITADPNKEQFSRLSVHELNPGNYFAIKDPNDKTKLLGCHIVDVVHDPREADDKSKTIARRRTYLKGGVSFVEASGQYEQAAPATPTVWTEVTHWTIGKWDDRNMKKADMEQVKDAKVQDVPMFQLPAPISSLPIYHWQNTRMDSGFGLSELSGIETLIAGINQGLSDTQLTMVLQGLGVYVTDSKPPQDETGAALPWNLGPGKVAEIAQGRKLERVSGVNSVSPALELVQEFKNDAQEASGIPDIAAGKVDVTVAESGISLQLQLTPILVAAKEKELEILGTMDHMLYDLITQWFPAYEGVSFSEDSSVVSHIEDAMPVNREARIQEVLLLFTSQLISLAEARAELVKFGYKFTASPEEVLKSAAALAKAQGGEDSRYAQETEPENITLREGATELSGDGLGGVAGGVMNPGSVASPTISV